MEWEVNLSLSTGNRIVVPEVPFLIGRAPECNFRLNRKSIGKRHCRLELGELAVEEAEDEDDEEAAPQRFSICIVQLATDFQTLLNRELLLPRKRAFLLLDEKHLLVLGDEEFSLIVHQKETHSRRGSYRRRPSPGNMKINRGGRPKSRWPDEFDDTLRDRKRG